MSRASPHRAAVVGRALVTLRNGTVYRGEAVYDGRTVTIDGRLRVASIIDGEQVYTYRPPRRRTLPIHLLREIVWIDP